MPTTFPRAVPDSYATTRASLHRVAAHVLARRRHAVTGRFGLRVTPGGFGTPLFGDPEHEEVLRVSAATLVREHRGDGVHTDVLPLDGASLASLADAVGVALDPGFSVGKDTPDLGDVDAPLSVSADAVGVMADFLLVGAAALDRVLAARGADTSPIVAQIWPEHFDLGLDVAGGGSRVNLGASVGDDYHADPYVYVGPWGSDRPGDPDYWNVGFGALLGYEAIAAASDPVAAVVAFMFRGLDLAGS
jgi:hypothetical protein